jgi:nucleoside-diphosphate-sugar epimerase
MNLMITGVSGHIGQAAVHHLTHQDLFKRVFAMDMIPPAFLGPCHFIQADLRSIEVADVLSTAHIHCVLHRAFNDRNASSESDAAIAEHLFLTASMAGVRRVVMPCRDWVYRRSETPSDERRPLRTLRSVQKRFAAVKSRFTGQVRLAPVEAKLRLEAMIGQYQKGADAIWWYPGCARC